MDRRLRLEELRDDHKSLVTSIMADSEPEAWETFSLSTHSSGPVGDSEVLVRFVLAPTHIDNNGNIDPSNLLMDAFVRGYSVNRVTAPTDVYSQIEGGLLLVSQWNEGRGEKPERRLFAICWCACAEIRGLLDDVTGKRIAIVCDTGLALNPRHADVIAVRVSKQNKQDIRIKLFEAMACNVHPIE